MAAFYRDTFAILFDRAGRVLEYAVRDTPPGTGPRGHGPSSDALREWQRYLGFEPRTIRVRRFSIPDVEVGIEDLPSHLADFLDDPESEPDPARREETAESARRWLEDGDFVLYWGNDLFVDAEGHVTSS